MFIGMAAGIIVASLASAGAAADDRGAWLREHAVRVRSIDPGAADYSDLAALKAAIGGARVVQLGEQSHGDGAVFLAKCRLVKFLHREMGFDVLVWESGMFDCRIADRRLRDAKEPLDAAWREGVFPIWGESAQVRPVIEYVREAAGGERPLEVAGYDCQVSSARPHRWLDAVREFAAPLGEGHPARSVIDALRPRIGLVVDPGADREKLEGVIQGLENLSGLLGAFDAKLAEAHGEAETEFMRRSVDDVIAATRMTLAWAASRGSPRAGDLNWRDQRMGENLVWLANERYKGRKLIVWAATMHEVHDVQAIRPAFNPDQYKGVVTAGTVAKRVLGDDLFTIGFEAHEGEVGQVFRDRPRALEPSPAGSLGAMLAELGHPFLYVDLRGLPEGHWLRGRVTMRPLGYAPMEAEWSRQMDGVFFIREMFPATRTGMAPEGAVVTVE